MSPSLPPSLSLSNKKIKNAPPQKKIQIICGAYVNISVSSTGLYGSARKVKSHLFEDVENLKTE
jgi:hypothetical protein